MGSFLRGPPTSCFARIDDAAPCIRRTVAPAQLPSTRHTSTVCHANHHSTSPARGRDSHRCLSSHGRKHLRKLFKAGLGHIEQQLHSHAVSRHPHSRHTPPATATSVEPVFSELLQQLRRVQFQEWAMRELDTNEDECEVQQAPADRSSAATGLAAQQGEVLLMPKPSKPSLPSPPLDDLNLDTPEFEARQYPRSGRVLVCQGSKCQARGGLDVLRAVSAVAGDSSNVQVLPCKCLGKCKEGAAMRVKQEGVSRCSVYTQLSAHQVPGILDAHFAEPAAPAAPEPVGGEPSGSQPASVAHQLRGGSAGSAPAPAALMAGTVVPGAGPLPAGAAAAGGLPAGSSCCADCQTAAPPSPAAA